MDYTPFSPFMRPISRSHLQPVPDAAGPVDKWEVLRDLAKARTAFGLGDRDLAVLQGLLSFHPGDMLDPAEDLVIFASNRAICERLNGMADSTMRRHLAKLVERGVIQRRDSPNGKRFRIKAVDDGMAFGLDLAPLPRRAAAFKDQAESFRLLDLKVKRLRMRISLMRRDLLALCDFAQGAGSIWDEVRALAEMVALCLRRKPDIAQLTQLSLRLATALEACSARLKPAEPEDLSAKAVQIEQHQQKAKEEEKIQIRRQGEETAPDAGRIAPRTPPLHLVTKACPEISGYAGGSIDSWPQLLDAASRLCPALGIQPRTWADATRAMGADVASVVVAVLLQRFAEIRSPGGYLRKLTAAAESGKFSCIAMVGRLLEPKCAA